MKMRSVAYVALLALATTALCAQTTTGAGISFSFASATEGKEVLTSPDEYVARMSPFDLAVRLMTTGDVSVSDYLESAGRSALEWTHAERQRVTNALAIIEETLEGMALPFPERILFIETTGREEGGAAYTRANAIVLPQSYANESEVFLKEIIAHELFHILSRANPGLRNRLYAAIGFETCDEVVLPPALISRRITNPDAPRNDHCIRVTVGDEEHWVVPILLAATERFDWSRGGDLFHYMLLQFVVVDGPDGGLAVDTEEPVLVGVEELSGFWKQVGNNTGYVMDPEEILADNFALLVLGQRDVASPEVLEKMEIILKAAGSGS